jgi:hypothetical protein
MAMIGSQPTTFAAISPESPTAPTPKTAKESPALGFMLLNTAPAPVWPLHAIGPMTSRGASFRTLTVKRSLASVWLAKEDYWK